MSHAVHASDACCDRGTCEYFTPVGINGDCYRTHLGTVPIESTLETTLWLATELATCTRCSPCTPLAPTAPTPHPLHLSRIPSAPCLNAVDMLLSVITFGLLGFASMPKHGHVPKDVASKPEGKCACGTYPLYLTEAEAGNSMCQRMLKWPALVHDSATALCNPPLSFRSGPGDALCAVAQGPSEVSFVCQHSGAMSSRAPTTTWPRAGPMAAPPAPVPRHPLA